MGYILGPILAGNSLLNAVVTVGMNFGPRWCGAVRDGSALKLGFILSLWQYPVCSSLLGVGDGGGDGYRSGSCWVFSGSYLPLLSVGCLWHGSVHGILVLLPATTLLLCMESILSEGGCVGVGWILELGWIVVLGDACGVMSSG
jgi:hypothetical protein